MDGPCPDLGLNGLIDPIVLDQEGRVLDGLHRYQACAAAQVEPRYVTFNGDNKAAFKFVLDANLHRRHLTESQRAMVAARLANMPHGGDRKSKNQDANLHIDRTQAAKQLSD